MIQVINEIDKFKNLKDDWERIWHNCKSATPFQTFDYVLASASTFHETDSLYIILMSDGNGVVRAILHTKIDKSGRLSFINAHHSDFCGIIIETEYDNFNLYEELSKFFLSNKQIKTICFDNLKRDSSLLSSFKPFIYTCFIQDINYYSVIPIFPKTIDKDFVDAFSFVASKRKKKLRNQHKATLQGCEFKIYDKANGDIYPEDVVNSLTEIMVVKGYRARTYFSMSMLNFWKELYEKELLICAVLRQGGVALSCNFMFYDSKSKEYIKWIMLYEDGHYNLAINVEIADYIYKNQGAYINFARGIYDYKMENFHPIVYPLYRVIITKSIWQHIKAVCCVTFNNVKTILKQYLKK